MLKNLLIVIDQAVNKCLDLDLTKFNQIEIVVGASQKTLPVAFVKELLRIQSMSGVPVELLTTKGTGSHHVEMYLAWLLGRHIEKLPDAYINVVGNNSNIRIRQFFDVTTEQPGQIHFNMMAASTFGGQ